MILWQPMEMATRDGAELLLFDPKVGIVRGFWALPLRPGQQRGMWRTVGDEWIELHPTWCADLNEPPAGMRTVEEILEYLNAHENRTPPGPPPATKLPSNGSVGR